MPRVAIIGSCITRDLWPIRGEALENVLYVSRTSLPSLFSRPVEGFQPAPEPPGELRRHQHNALVADLTKTNLARLVAFAPTHLIFDFIDERFDLLSIGSALATHSWELDASNYLTNPALVPARPIKRLSEACGELWIAAAAEMAALVRATPLARARLILHSARWATEYRAAGGRLTALRDVEIKGGQPADIGRQNTLLAQYEARFSEVMPPLERLEAADLRLADEAHRWGLSPFHYIPEYYDEIWRQLADLGVRRPAPDGS